MLLRPYPHSLADRFIVVGPCYVHGLMDSEALLGPLPEPWSIQLAQGYVVQIFRNSTTGVLAWDDPRLDPLPPEEWERVKVDEFRGVKRTRDDPILVQYFRNKRTGRVIDSDPRLLPSSLGKRGVKLSAFRLV